MSKLTKKQKKIAEMMEGFNQPCANAIEAIKKLQEVAQIKAKDLVESEDFSHYSLTYGKTFNIMKDKGIEYDIAGENLEVILLQEEL